MSRAAFEKFRRSMIIGCAEWHEGIGYDLDALAALPFEDREAAEDLVVARRGADWRDLEALDHFGSSRALGELEKALRAECIELRVEAARRLAERQLLDEPTLEAIIVEALGQTTILDGMVKTLHLAATHPTQAVRVKLLYCALHGNDDIRVHAAALVHFLYGRSSAHFDMAFRPLYLRFGSKDRQERRAAYLNLCASIEVDPETHS